LELFTEIEYLHRDYWNYKFYGSFVVSGEVSFSQISKYLHEHKQFVPREIGVPNLTPSALNEDDHWLHELVSCCISGQSYSEPIMSSKELLARLRKCEKIGWLLLCPWV
jgi:hypothetical protein